MQLIHDGADAEGEAGEGGDPVEDGRGGDDGEDHEPEPEEDEDLLDDDVGGKEAQEVHGLHAAALAHLPPDTHAQPGHQISLHVT